MKQHFFGAVLLVLPVLVGFGVMQDWVKYTSAEGHFSIILPGKPVEQSAEQNNNGHVYTMHYATYNPNGDKLYICNWTDISQEYPKDKTIKELLEAARDYTGTLQDNTTITTLAINTGENPYIEFSFIDKKFTGKQRIYIINKVQYSLLAMFTLKTGIPADTDKFLSSFTLLP